MMTKTPSLEDLQTDSEALQRLIDEYALLKETIQQSPAQYCVYDDDGRLVLWNQAYEHAHPKAFAKFYANGADAAALTYKEIMRSSLQSEVPEDEIDGAIKATAVQFKAFKAGVVERQYASVGWLGFTSFPLPSGGVAAMAVNITELKERERELTLARQRAEEGKQAKADFLASMTHEIRTPMNGVLGMAELLRHSDLDDRQRLFVESISKSGDALLNIVNDVLDMSKIEAGQLRIDQSSFDFREMAEDVAWLMSGGAAEKSIGFFMRIDPRLPQRMVGDAGRVRQILLNLVGNAIKFTDKGHVVLSIKPSNGVCEDDQLGLRITVEDTGPGLSPEHCQTVFQQFEQADREVGRALKGTGLGLAIVASLAKLMGGQVGVESEPGEGSTFWCEVVLGQDQICGLSPAIRGDLRGTVLLLDACVTSREIMVERLESKGVTCLAVGNTNDAIEMISRRSRGHGKIDAIILSDDPQGQSTLRLLRANPRWNAIRTILCKPIHQGAGSLSFCHPNAFANLTAPVRSKQLRETLEAAFQNDTTALYLQASTRPPPKFAFSH